MPLDPAAAAAPLDGGGYPDDAAHAPHGSSKVQVHVRIRPLNSREISLNAQIILKETQSPDTLSICRPSLPASSVPGAAGGGGPAPPQPSQGSLPPRSGTPGDRTSVISTISHLSSSTAFTNGSSPGGGASSNDSSPLSPQADDIKNFTFDGVFWSCFPDSPNCASQETVYTTVGSGLLDHAFGGYNVCLFAYGQTGSGKSYTMMGSPSNRGVIPRVCEDIFQRISADTVPNTTYEVTVSYIEIYNERVRDLLNPSNKNNLRIREHPQLGPYVEDLSKLAVTSYESVERLMEIGNKARIVASTNMNETSSRSHAVFTLVLTQTRTEPLATTPAPGANGATQRTERTSRISLVDLAGSERADATGAKGVRLKEGSAINKSLTTLGKVISALAEAGSSRESAGGPAGSAAAGAGPNLNRRPSTRKLKPEAAAAFIPYRDSVLTWLLKDSLGGNAKTVMLAALSPSDTSYDETLSTLRFAERAKRIETRAVVNEDETGKTVRLLKEEVARLKAIVANYEAAAGGGGAALSGDSASNLVPVGRSADDDDSRASPTLIRTPRTAGIGRMRSLSNMTAAPTVLTNQTAAGGADAGVDMASLREELMASEKLIDEMTSSLSEKLEKTERIAKQDMTLLERDRPVSGRSSPMEPPSYNPMSAFLSMGVQVPRSVPHLVNLSEDLLPSECVLYRLPPGTHTVGSSPEATIRLEGEDILENHASFECAIAGGASTSPSGSGSSDADSAKSTDGVALAGTAVGATTTTDTSPPTSASASLSPNQQVIVTLHAAPGSMTFVDGQLVTGPSVRLASGARVGFGQYHLFRFSNPSDRSPSSRRWRPNSMQAPSPLSSPAPSRPVSFVEAPPTGTRTRTASPMPMEGAPPTTESSTQGPTRTTPPPPPIQIPSTQRSDTATTSRPGTPGVSGAGAQRSGGSGTDWFSPMHEDDDGRAEAAAVAAGALHGGSDDASVSNASLDVPWPPVPFADNANPSLSIDTDSGPPPVIPRRGEPTTPAPTPIDPQTSAAVLSAAAAHLRATLLMDVEARIRLAQALGGGAQPGAALVDPRKTVYEEIAVGGPQVGHPSDPVAAAAAAQRLSWLLDQSALSSILPFPPVNQSGHPSAQNSLAAYAAAAAAATTVSPPLSNSQLSPTIQSSAGYVSEVEERVRALEVDLAQEKEKMRKVLEVQKQTYEARLRRLQAKRGSAIGGAAGEVEELTERQRSAVWRAYRQWRWRCVVRLAEDILQYAALVKEANIIARELNKNVMYELVVVDDASHLNPVSFWESNPTFASDMLSLASPSPASSRLASRFLPPSASSTPTASPLSSSGALSNNPAATTPPRPRPVIAVRVLDGRHNSIHHWPLTALPVRVPIMRAQYEVSDMAATFYVQRRAPGSDGCFYDVAGPADDVPVVSVSANSAAQSAASGLAGQAAGGSGVPLAKRPPLPGAPDKAGSSGAFVPGSSASAGSSGSAGASAMSASTASVFSPLKQLFSGPTPKLPPPLPPGVMVGSTNVSSSGALGNASSNSSASGASGTSASSRRKPYYDLIGSAMVGVLGLGFGFARETRCPVVDASSGAVKGWLRIVVSPISSEPPDAGEDDEDDDDDVEALDASGDVDGPAETPYRAAAAGRRGSRQMSFTEIFNRSLQSTSRRRRSALAAAAAAAAAASDDGDRPESYLQDGGTLVFEVSILEMTGISEREYTQVHCQFRASQFERPHDADSPSDTLRAGRRAGGGGGRGGVGIGIGGVPGMGSDHLRVLATDPKSDFGEHPVRWEFSQTLTVRVTPGLQEVISRRLVRFDVFGRRVKPISAVIEEAYAAAASAGAGAVSQSIPRGLLAPAAAPTSSPSSASGGMVVGARIESGGSTSSSSSSSSNFGSSPGIRKALSIASLRSAASMKPTVANPTQAIMARHRHIILSQVEVAELSQGSGEFVGVPVQSLVSATPAAEKPSSVPSPSSNQFLLRQGMQRRISLRLSHAAGHTGFPWRRISYVRVGRIRRVNVRTGLPLEEDLDDSLPYAGFVELALPAAGAGDESGAASAAGLPGENRPVVSSDGRSRLEVSVPWDSSLHNCVHLNRPSKRGVRLEMTIAWGVEVDAICDEGGASQMFGTGPAAQPTRGRRNSTGDGGDPIRSRSGSVSSIASFGSDHGSVGGGGGDEDEDASTRWLLFSGPVHFEATVGVIVNDRDTKLRASAKFMEMMATAGMPVTGLRYHSSLSLLSEVRLAASSLTLMSAVSSPEPIGSTLMASTEEGSEVIVRPAGRRRSWKAIDARTKYVRGEECLGGWVPGGQEVVLRYWVGRERRRWFMEVEMWRQRLEDLFGTAAVGMGVSVDGSGGGPGNNALVATSSPFSSSLSATGAGEHASTSEREQYALLRKCVDLWRRPAWMRDPCLDKLLYGTPPSQAFAQDEEPVLWVKAALKPVSRVGPMSMKGWLYTPDDQGSWVRRYFLLRRPCLHVFAKATDVDEIAVFSLKDSLVEYGPALGTIGQQHPFAFALLTKYSSLLLLAASKEEMDKWVTALDPLHVAAILSRRSSDFGAFGGGGGAGALTAPAAVGGDGGRQ
ncbi:hypothetical protein DFJ73DRAFT_965856 [Zopfochytrium polystomum]|nr:hypothetical protein DFJ73DRAFT_965856 [Zopfochytrium polystomum]